MPVGAALKVFSSVALGLVFVAILAAIVLVQELQPTTITARNPAGYLDDRNTAPAAGVPSQSASPVIPAADEKARDTRKASTPGGPGGDAEQSRALQPDRLQSRLAEEQSKSAGADRDLALARADLASMRAQIVEARLRDETQQAAAAASHEKLAEEQAKSARLEADLATARTNLVGAQAQIAASAQQNGEAQQAAVASQTKLAEEQAKSTRLDQALAKAEAQLAAVAQQQTTAQQTDAAWQRKLGEEQARSERLDHDLATARIDLASTSAQLNDATRQQTEIQQAAEAQVHSAEEQREREHQAAIVLESKRAEAERDVLGLQAQLRDEQENVARVSNDLAVARMNLARAQETEVPLTPRSPAQGPDPKSASIAARVQASLQSTETADVQPASTSDPQGEATDVHAPPVGHPELRSGPLAHVVLRYVRHNDKARAHADALKITLQDRGFAVTDPVGTPFTASATKLSFFYQEDQAEAERLAGILAMPKPARGSVSVDDPLPRPGTIEIIVGG